MSTGSDDHVGSEDHTARDWLDDPDLPESPSPEPLPLDAIPTGVRAQIESVTGYLQVPSDLPLMLALLAACQETTVTLTERCDVYLSALAPDAALPGAPVVATARPLTQPWDTVVHVGGSPAKVDGLFNIILPVIQDLVRELCSFAVTCTHRCLQPPSQLF